MLKRSALLTCSVLAGTVPQAIAADMPIKAPDPVAVATPSWAGFYIGAGVGRNETRTRQGSFTNTATTTVPVGGVDTTVDTFSLDQQHFTNSQHVLGGYLWQYQRFLFGFEGDYSWGGSYSVAQRYLLAPGCSAQVP